MALEDTHKKVLAAIADTFISKMTPEEEENIIKEFARPGTTIACTSGDTFFPASSFVYTRS